MSLMVIKYTLDLNEQLSSLCCWLKDLLVINYIVKFSFLFCVFCTSKDRYMHVIKKETPDVDALWGPVLPQGRP